MRCVTVFCAGTAALLMLVAGARGAEPERMLLFSGFDIWREGNSMHGGLIWSPGGLDRDGFALKLLTAAGTYRYQSGGLDRTGRYTLVSIMPGWRLSFDRFEIKAFAGIDAQYHRIKPDDLSSDLRGSNMGLRAGADLWAEPSSSLMVSASAWGSSIGASYWTRAAVGWKIAGLVWVGPEIGAQGNTEYHEFRIGAHATGLRTGPLEWAMGVGLATDSKRRSGLYGHMGLLTRR